MTRKNALEIRMGVPDSNSDIEEESQATQLLRSLMNPEEDSWKLNDTRRPGQGSDSNVTKSSTTDSSPARNPSSLPNFDFHGLAQTQTQLLDEETNASAGSQKENIGSREEQLLSGQMISSMHGPTGVTKHTTIAVKAAFVQSPRKKTTIPQPINGPGHQSKTRPNTTPETTKPPSKPFNVPLSELTRVVPSAAAAPTSRQSLDSMHSRLLQYQRSPSPFEGTVLVASTPSISGGSQSQSQPFLEAQLPESFPTHQLDYTEGQLPSYDNGDVSRYSIEDCLSDAPSNFYADQDEDSLPPTAFSATQPSTQLGDEETMDVEQIHPFDAPVPDSTALSTSSNPKSLLSMVDPKKRHRYRHLVQPQNQARRLTTNLEEARTPSVQLPNPIQQRSPTPPKLASGSGPALHASSEVLVETQPSLVDEIHEPSPRRFPGRLSTNNALMTHQKIVEDRMDVVPDSEPSRDENLAQDEIPQDTNTHSGNTEIAPKPPIFGDDDVDEDVPLATVVHSRDNIASTRTSKGKEKAYHPDDLMKSSGFRQGNQPFPTRSNARDILQMPSAGLQGPTPNVRATRASTLLPKNKPSGAARSWQNGVIPSSFPDEDPGQAGVKTRASVVPAKKGNGKAANAQAAKLKSKPTVPAKRTRRRAVSKDEESPPSSEDELLMRAGGDDDSNTEPADDEYMDPDFVGQSSKKRKRSAPPATKAKSKPSKRVKKVVSTTPSTRQMTRLRSVASTSRSGEVTAATRVFALWRQDGCYYPGTVYQDLGSGVYSVHFDDQTEARVNIDHMRLLDLRVGDDVMFADSIILRGFKVTAVDKLRSSDIISVRSDAGNTEREVQSLRIASKTISATWQDRVLYRHSISPVIKMEAIKASPAPSGQSLTTAPSRHSGHDQVFEKTAFVISVSSNENNWERERESLISSIKSNGGVIINDWSDVIRMDGSYSERFTSWCIEKHEAKWIGIPNIERVFLVADQPSHKPKFLLALALGIPCLKVEWLHDTVNVGEERDWLAYMLGQGFSEALATQVSQQVDMNWGNSVHHLNDIMGNKVPCKLFNRKSILCVGDMVPKTKGKKLSVTEEKSQEAHNAVTRIILAMGADRVEAVTDIEHASAPLEDFDFVVIKKDEHYCAEMVADKTVNWHWVKDCLVASRLLPQPRWESESQEA